MRWVAPSEKDVANHALEKSLWAAADQLRANSGLTSAQYSTPVLGLNDKGRAGFVMAKPIFSNFAASPCVIS